MDNDKLSERDNFIKMMKEKYEYKDDIEFEKFIDEKIFKKIRKERWLDGFFRFLLNVNFRWIGFFIIFVVLVNHFFSQFNSIEIILIGLGMGLHIKCPKKMKT